MSGRARVPVGASERVGIFGNPATARSVHSSEADFLSTKQGLGRKDVPLAVLQQQQQHQHQHQPGSATATPYGALSPGRRRWVLESDIGDWILKCSVLWTKPTPRDLQRVDEPAASASRSMYRNYHTHHTIRQGIALNPTRWRECNICLLRSRLWY